MTKPVLDDQRMDGVVHEWLHDDDEHVPDRAEQVGRIMDRVDATKQRRRGWPLIPFGRRAVHSADSEDRSLDTRGGLRRLSPLGTIAALAVLVVGGSLLLYTAGQAPPPTIGQPGALPMLPQDEELFARMDEVWRTDDTVGVPEVYAPDAVHTVLWHDQVDRIEGTLAIARRLTASVNLPEAENQVVRLPDAANDARRYLSVRDEAGGMPCVFWIEDDRITRHDCIIPMASTDPYPPYEPGTPPDDVSHDDISVAMLKAWNEKDREVFEQVYSPDIVHRVAYSNTDVTHRGSDLYWSIIQYGDAVEKLAKDIDLPAPEGELRWTNYSDVGGGTLCTFWVEDGQVARHDCIVPTRSY